jgi:glyoxylate/hydroxypyruvate reductase
VTLLLLPISAPPSEWITAFASQWPQLEVRVWPAVGERADIEVAALGSMPPDGLGELPNLRLIVSLLAGQDVLLANPALPRGVPIVRAANPAGDEMMNHTVLVHVLRHHHNLPHYALAQRRSEWAQHPPLRARERTVGIAGFGLLGRAAARSVASLGFRTRVWSRGPHQLEGISMFSGPDQLHEFLSECEILVNLLPLTSATRDLFCARTLSWLPRGAAFINLARGEHVVEKDLLEALDRGQLSAATLDVFRTEPLPPQSPLWTHDRITITPHVARRLIAAELVPSICDNIRRLHAGEPLLNLVDMERGY